MYNISDNWEYESSGSIGQIMRCGLIAEIDCILRMSEHTVDVLDYINNLINKFQHQQRDLDGYDVYLYHVERFRAQYINDADADEFNDAAFNLLMLDYE
jgi:hypothetical protein